MGIIDLEQNVSGNVRGVATDPLSKQVVLLSQRGRAMLRVCQ